MEAEIDLEALEKNIQATLGEPDDNNVEETEEVAEEATGEENEAAPDESEETFDLDEALNSDQPIALAGRLTEEQAREEAAKRGWWLVPTAGDPERRLRNGHCAGSIVTLSSD